jgi:hypothetical protein
VTPVTPIGVTDVTAVRVTGDTASIRLPGDTPGRWAKPLRGRDVKGVTRMPEKKISPKKQGSSSSSSKSAATRVTKRKAKRQARRKGK